MVRVSAGKYWIGAVTATGDVYMWDGKKGKDKPPIITRLHGVKRATSVSVGETHLLIVAALHHPVYSPNEVINPLKQKLSSANEIEDVDEGLMFNNIEDDRMSSGALKEVHEDRPVPSLKSLCEKVTAECLVEPRNALQLLEIADSLEADNLKKHCEVWFLFELHFRDQISVMTEPLCLYNYFMLKFIGFLLCRRLLFATLTIS